MTQSHNKICKLSKLTVTSFRGVPHFELDFPEKTPCYLIGPNNAGKSTILKAVAFALKAGGFHKFSPENYDFFHNSNGEMESAFTVKIDFSTSGEKCLPSVHSIGAVKEVHGIDVKGNYYKTSDRMTHSHHLLDADGKAILLQTETKLSKKDEDDFSRDHGFKQRNARLDDIRDSLPEVWLLTASNLDQSLRHWKTGPLNKLAKILSQKFFEEKWEFNFNGNKKAMPEGIHQAHAWFSSAVKEFPYWKETMKPALEGALSSYLGKQTSVELNPLLQSIEEWLQQQLLLSFANEAGQVLTPLDRMGDGFQSLVRLAALEVLSNLDESTKDNIVVLYEEPETYLHPHLKRKLRDIFARLSEKGWYVLCATHSPEFISFENGQSISRIVKNQDQLDHGRILTSELPDSLKLQEKLDEYGNHELFFAQKVILCEGKDDLFAIRTFLEKSGVDMDSRSVSVLSCGSVGNVPDFASLANKLKIPFCAVTDRDMQDNGAVKSNTEDARKKIEAIKSTDDLMVEWDNTLEDCLQTPAKQNGDGRRKASPEWQRDNVANQDIAAFNKAFPKYQEACQKIVDWVSGHTITLQGNL